MKKVILIIGVSLFTVIAVVAIVGVVMYNQIFTARVKAGGKGGIPAAMEEPTPLVDGRYNWPSYKGSNADNRSEFTSIKTDWREGLDQLWEVDYLCEGDTSITWSCASIYGNRLVVPGRSGTTDHIFALDPDSGSLIWHQQYDAPSENSDFGDGQRATPTIDENRVYTLSHSGLLYCFDLYDGTVIWIRDIKDEGAIIPKWGFSGSPVINNDQLLVHTGGDSLLIAFNKYDGTISWKSAPGAASYSTPVVETIDGKDRILVLGGQNFYGFTPEGTKLWEIPWPVNNNINITTPVFDEENNIAVISAWYNTGSNALRLTADTAVSIWTSTELQAHQNDPFILDNAIFGFSGMSSYNRGEFVCLDIKSGEKLWGTRDLGTGVFIRVEPYFLSLDVKGSLYLFEADREGFTVKSKIENLIEVDSARAWTKPVIADGKLYIRYANKLYCFDIGA
jgi:outer membrane protein assembly factor BamB